MRCTCEQAVNEAMDAAKVVPKDAYDKLYALWKALNDATVAEWINIDSAVIVSMKAEIATLRQQNADLSDALALANETISRMSRCMTAGDIQRAREAGDIDT
jgi:hypothetical protein